MNASGTTRPCDFMGCPDPGFAAWGHSLCIEHGVAATKYVDTTLPYDSAVAPGSRWGEQCTAVGNWLESKRPQVRKMAAGG